MDVAAWLQGLGLERYVLAFRDNEIDGDALPKLSEEDLKDLGSGMADLESGAEKPGAEGGMAPRVA
jgi:hypothetical protein